MNVTGGKISLLKRIVQNPRVITVLTVGAILSFGVLYVGQVNAAATKGYFMRDLQEENTTLRQECDRLDIQVAKLRSVHSIKSREAFLGLTPLAPKAFVKIDSDTVAVR